MNDDLNRNNKIFVKKASGEEEPFDINKLKSSLDNAGADEKIIKEIVADIEDWLYTGITTKKIYSRAFLLLRRKKIKTALRYKIKQAILQLGPTGYPFESLVGKIFEKQGYSVKVAKIIQGNCISHEMDVIATKGKSQNLIECKYSQDQGKQISIQVPLYVHSRVEDIIRKQKEFKEYQECSFKGWVVTNTRFSTDSMEYGKCIGLNLLGWDYPFGEGLKDIIEKINIYPITLLNYLNKKEKKYLFDNGIVICTQLFKNREVLQPLKLNDKKYKNLMKELENFCS